ncbi:hypothetical protein Brsp02_04897 [Brucella sp. NBRC 113783]
MADRNTEELISKTMKAGARYYRKSWLQEALRVIVLAVGISLVLYFLSVWTPR